MVRPKLTVGRLVSTSSTVCSVTGKGGRADGSGGPATELAVVVAVLDDPNVVGVVVVTDAVDVTVVVDAGNVGDAVDAVDVDPVDVDVVEVVAASAR